MNEFIPAPHQIEPTPLRQTTLARRRLATALAVTAAGLTVKFGVPPVVHAIESSHGQAPADCEVTVQPGDTLWSIARRETPDRDARLEVADIRRLNNMPSADLRGGEELQVPCAPSPTDIPPASPQG